VRVALDDFKIDSPAGLHQCLVFTPLGLTYTQVRNVFPERTFDKEMVQMGMYVVLLGLDYLHGLGVVHTGNA